MKTIGELKALIKDLPDDMPIVMYRQDMERRGFFNEVYAEVNNFSQKTASAVDAFDHTPYSYEKYVQDKSGTPCLSLIN